MHMNRAAEQYLTDRGRADRPAQDVEFLRQSDALESACFIHQAIHCPDGATQKTPGRSAGQAYAASGAAECCAQEVLCFK